MQGDRELLPEAVPGVAVDREAQPVLADFAEGVPALDVAGCQGLVRVVPQESEVINDLLVQRPVLLLVAVEEQKRVDEDGKIGDHGDVECAPLLEHLRVDVEAVAEVDASGISGP